MTYADARARAHGRSGKKVVETRDGHSSVESTSDSEREQKATMARNADKIGAALIPQCAIMHGC